MKHIVSSYYMPQFFLSSKCTDETCPNAFRSFSIKPMKYRHLAFSVSAEERMMQYILYLLLFIYYKMYCHNNLWILSFMEVCSAISHKIKQKNLAWDFLYSDWSKLSKLFLNYGQMSFQSEQINKALFQDLRNNNQSLISTAKMSPFMASAGAQRPGVGILNPSVCHTHWPYRYQSNIRKFR